MWPHVQIHKAWYDGEVGLSTMNGGKTMEMAGFCKNRSVGRGNKIQNC